MSVKLSKTAGLRATATGYLADIPMEVSLNITKATPTGTDLSIDAKTKSAVDLGNTVAAIWPNAPVIARELLGAVTFPQVAMSYNSKVKALAIRALPGAAGLPNLNTFVKNAGDAFTVKAPVFHFSATPDVVGSLPSFTISALIDFPSLGMSNAAASIMVAPSGELRLQVGTPFSLLVIGGNACCSS